ncbi:protein of unknown function [Methylocella tundrae]|uniref:Uncharacterized protein n=1 Tax=Methylocella tundrae TaxID=227605 RepID=A0A4U8YZD5_METTU|nr:protein of unknown function [Methylocella tundrae]
MRLMPGPAARDGATCIHQKDETHLGSAVAGRASRGAISRFTAHAARGPSAEHDIGIEPQASRNIPMALCATRRYRAHIAPGWNGFCVRMGSSMR